MAVGLATALAWSTIGGVPARAEDLEPPATLARVGVPSIVELDLAAPYGVLGGLGEVYVTGDDELQVVTLNGEVVGVVEGLPGAGPMALAPDGEVLFVGLRGARAVVAIDLEDLTELARWDLPSRPVSLLARDTMLYVGTGTAGQAADRTHLVTIDGDGPVTARETIGGPVLTADEHGLIVGSGGISAADVERRTMADESLAPPVVQRVKGVLRDLVHDPVEDVVYLAGSGQTGPSNYALTVLDPADLQPVRSVDIGPHPYAVTPLGDGRHVAVGRRTGLAHEADVVVHRSDAGTAASPVAPFRLPGLIVERGLSTTSDGTLVAITEPSGAGGWLTIIPEPTRRTPQLSVNPAAATVDDPVTVSGVFASPLGAGSHGGVEIAVLDPLGAAFRATTDEFGGYSVTIPPPTAAGPLSLRVVNLDDGIHRSIEQTRVLTVAPRTLALELEPVPPIRAGDALEVSGQVTDTVRDMPAPAGVPVNIEVVRIGSATATHPAVTDGDGRIVAQVPTSDAGVHTVQLRVTASDRYRAADSPPRTADARERTSRVVELRAPLTAGHPGVIEGRLVDEDGAPRVEHPVTLRLDGHEVTTVRTDPAGRFAASVTPGTSGRVSLRVTAPPDDLHEPMHHETPIDIALDRSAMTIASTSGTARAPVTVTGTIRDGLARPVTGRMVDARVVDSHGVEVIRQPLTDAHGRWTITFTPRHGGSHTVIAELEEGGGLTAARVTRSLSIARATTTVSLAALTGTVDHGTKVTLTGRVTTPSGAWLDLVAVDLATGTATRVARAQVDTQGRLSRTVTARANTRYEARFRGDTTYAPITAQRTVQVRGVVTATVSGHDRTVDGRPSFARSSRPTVSMRVRSAQPDTRLTVTLQRWDGSTWKPHAEWPTRATDGRATARTPSGLGKGSYRLRVTAPSTISNHEGRSEWVRFQVR
jgi:hypothetical protein